MTTFEKVMIILLTLNLITTIISIILRLKNFKK